MTLIENLLPMVANVMMIMLNLKTILIMPLKSLSVNLNVIMPVPLKCVNLEILINVLSVWILVIICLIVRLLKLGFYKKKYLLGCLNMKVII